MVSMRVTTGHVARFVGGQMEIQNKGEGYMFRGEIQKIEVAEAENELRVKFAWIAKGEGYPPLPKRWVRDEQVDYAASLEVYTASDIGPSETGGSRLCFQSSIVGETVVLFPPDGSKLDRSKVEEPTATVT